MNDQKVEVTLALVNGVLSYLGTKPYQETYQLIQAIQEQVIPQVQIPTPAEQPQEEAPQVQ